MMPQPGDNFSDGKLQYFCTLGGDGAPMWVSADGYAYQVVDGGVGPCIGLVVASTQTRTLLDEAKHPTPEAIHNRAIVEQARDLRNWKEGYGEGYGAGYLAGRDNN